MKSQLLPLLAIGCLSVGCKKDEPAPAAAAPSGPRECAPLEVSIDGKPVSTLVHGLAVTEKLGSVAREVVHLFDSSAVTCEKVMGRSLVLPAETLHLSAHTASSAMKGGVGGFGPPELGIAVELTSAAPAKAGDTVTLCVPKTTFTSSFGTYEGKKITVSGSVTGTWCGASEP